MLTIHWCGFVHLCRAPGAEVRDVAHHPVRRRTNRQPDDRLPAGFRNRRSRLALAAAARRPHHAATVDQRRPSAPLVRRAIFRRGEGRPGPRSQARGGPPPLFRRRPRRTACARWPGTLAPAMSATRINHVSVHAPALATSVAWYEDLFGARRIATPNFGMPVQWLAIGDTQLHLFQRDTDAPSHHHFAFAVDDFPPVYRRAGELGAYDHEAFGHHFFELPGDTAQLYLRDPGGNLVEVDAPRLSALPEEILADRKRLADVRPQDDENLRARLYLSPAQSSAESPVA